MGTAGKTLAPSQKIAWLRLIRTPTIGPVTFRQLINRTGSAEAALDAVPSLAKKVGAPAKIPSISEAEDEIAAVAARGGHMVAMGEPGYPPHLQHISGAPPLLSLVGGEKLDLERMVAVVGARNASAAGQRMTEVLSTGLGQQGFTVVSGLARGIDAAAHRAALPTGTIAVLAGGLDRIYPSENVPLADAIIAEGGMVLTEMPMGWEPRAQDFPRRNRLVSGSSLGVVVVEAAKRSGSLITARLALEQNREFFAIPGSPLDPRSEGGNHLIQQGAKLVTCADDIIESLTGIDLSRQTLFEPEWQPSPDEQAEIIDPTSDDRLLLLDALSPAPTAVDQLISTTGLRAPVVQMLLLELDIAGRIEWSSGQLVALRP